MKSRRVLDSVDCISCMRRGIEHTATVLIYIIIQSKPGQLSSYPWLVYSTMYTEKNGIGRIAISGTMLAATECPRRLSLSTRTTGRRSSQLHRSDLHTRHPPPQNREWRPIPAFGQQRREAYLKSTFSQKFLSSNGWIPSLSRSLRTPADTVCELRLQNRRRRRKRRRIKQVTSGLTREQQWRTIWNAVERLDMCQSYTSQSAYLTSFSRGSMVEKWCWNRGRKLKAELWWRYRSWRGSSDGNSEPS